MNALSALNFYKIFHFDKINKAKRSITLVTLDHFSHFYLFRI